MWPVKPKHVLLSVPSQKKFADPQFRSKVIESNDSRMQTGEETTGLCVCAPIKEVMENCSELNFQKKLELDIFLFFQVQ